MSLSQLVSSVDVPGYGPRAIRTSYATLIPPGARIAAYVRSGGFQELDPFRQADLVPSLAAALPRVRAGYGDVILVLPGHAESVTDATMLDGLRAGTQILGLGHGSMQPTFNWTATGSQWTVDQNDVLIQGLRLNLDGADGVVNAIDITGADCEISGCQVRLASGAALKATIGISISTGAHRAAIRGCKFLGTGTHNVTDGVLVDVALDGVEITDNVILASATAARGLIHVTAAALNLFIARNRVENTHTSSSAGIVVDSVAATGQISDNYVGVLNDGTAASQGIVLAGTATVKCFNNYCSDEARESGVLAPAAAGS